MFIPSMLKSVQTVSVNAIGDFALGTTVNKDYALPINPGAVSANNSGFILQAASAPRLKLTTNSNLHCYNVDFAGNAYSFLVTILEFLPLFFRQAIHVADINVSLTSTTNTYASGLTLGPKAFIIPLGGEDNIDNTLSGGTLTAAQKSLKLELNIATGVVTATRYQANYGADTGGVTFSFAIVDPK